MKQIREVGRPEEGKVCGVAANPALKEDNVPPFFNPHAYHNEINCTALCFFICCGITFYDRPLLQL